MKKIILFLFLFLISQCGFKPVLISKDSNFSINEIKYNQKKLSSKMNNGLKVYQKKGAVDPSYNLEITITEKKITTLKDSKGDPLNFRININVELKVFLDKELIFTKLYSESADYKNTGKKFELIQREKVLKNSLVSLITKNLINDLQSIR